MPISADGQARASRPNGSTSGPSARQPEPSLLSSATPELERRPTSSSTTVDEEQAQPEREKGLDDTLAAIGELIGAPSTATSEEAAAGERGDETPVSGALRGADGKFRARTLAEVAEHLDIAPDQFYGLALTTGDGETVTLGALKDAWQEGREAQRETAQRETGLDEREAALRAEQALWEPILAELRDKVPQDFQARLRGQAEQTLSRERSRLRAAMPELADEAHFDGFRGKVIEFLSTYGYTPREMAITDHRMLVILRDHMRLKDRLEQLLAYEPERRPPEPSPARGRQPAKRSRAKQLVETARRSGRQQDQLDAISGLIDER